MISIIICSINAPRFARTSAMYHQKLSGQEYEIIHINDARSLAEGYRRGIERSRGEILVLSHDDVEIISDDLAGKLKRHLNDFDLLGVAGTSRLISPRWDRAGHPYIFGQIAIPVIGTAYFRVDVFGVPTRVVANIQALDGVFLAMRRSLTEHVKFDESLFDGFHLYDIDFSYSAHLSGAQLAVCNDINLVHPSAGDYSGADWDEYAKRFQAKHQSELAKAQFPNPRGYQWAHVDVFNRAAAIEVMNPTFWDAFA